MAKKDEKIVPTKDEPKELAIPEDLKAHAGAGTEGITSKDVRPPRMILAQAMSPQVKRSDPKYIMDLGEGDLFNDLSQAIYGEGPIDFCVIAFLGSRFVEFDETGKVRDGNVQSDDKRTEWTLRCKSCDVKFTGDRRICPKCNKGADVEGVKPVASRFYDYLLWLPESQEVVTFSMKNKQAGTVGINLNSMLKLPLNVGGALLTNPPACARLFQISTSMDKNEKGSWAVVSMAPKGITDEKDRLICYELMNSFKGKNVVIEHDEGDADEATGEFARDM
jgi:hypothetical protein